MEQVIAYGVSFVLGISAVSVFIGKYALKAKKYIGVAKEALDIVDALVKAIEDGEVSEEEIKNIVVQAQELRDAVKK